MPAETIRPYRQADEEALRGLVLQLHENLRTLDRDLAPGDSILERCFHHLIRQVEKTSGAIYIAEDSDRLVGYVCVCGAIGPEDLDERPDYYGFMAELYVLPEYRGHGIGRALAERAERHVSASGAYKIELKVLARNQAAVRFYEALGYSPRIIIMSKRTTATASE